MVPHSAPAQSALSGKLIRPRRHQVYLRQRLYEDLAAREIRSGIWVYGPAGSGKTTLVNSYLHDKDIPCLWYSVDESDADLASFFHYLNLALSRLGGDASAPRLQFGPEFLNALPVFTRRFFEQFYALLPRPCAVVLDNYQDVGEDVLLHEVLCTALSLLPDQVFLYVLSRKEPPAELARERATCRVSLLGWSQLRFSEQETRGMAEMVGTEKCSQDLALDLYHKTDGWVAGLLLLLNRSNLDQVSPRHLSRNTPEEIFDYFAGEIFIGLEPSFRELLIRLAHLPVITQAGARRLTGVPDPAQALYQLERRNAFTFRLMRDEPTFRLHPLFREFLQRRAQQDLSPEQLAELLRESAQVLESEGDLDNALPLYFKAGAMDQALALFLAKAPEMSVQGRFKTLEQWLQGFPPEMTASIPWLVFWKGACQVPVDPGRARRILEDCFPLFEAMGEREGLYLALSGILDAITYEFAHFAELDPWIERYEDLYARFGPPRMPEVHIRVTTSLLNACTGRNHVHPIMPAMLKQAWDILHAVKDPNISMQLFSPLITFHVLRGDHPAAAHALSLFREVSCENTLSMSFLIYQNCLSFHNWLCGRFQEGLDAARMAMRTEQETGVRLLFLALRCHGAASAMGLGDLALAEKILAEAQPFLDRQGIWLLALYHTMFGWLRLVQGDPVQAHFHAHRGHTLALESGSRLTLADGYVQCAITLYETGKRETARKMLDQGLQYAEEYTSHQIRFIALLTRARFALDSGGEREIREALETAFAQGRQWNFRYAFFWQPRVMARLCAEALKRDIETEYVQGLVQEHRLIPDTAPLDVPSWPWPVRIHTLGGFRLEKDGQAMHFSRKAQQRPLALLKSLLAHGGIKVPDHSIHDDFWPEAEGDDAKNALSTALHRARKLLGDNQAILLSQGRLSLNEQLCWTDTWALERLFERIAGLPDDADVHAAEQCLERFNELYAGPFLQGEEESWVIPPRERFQSRALSMLQRLGAIFEARNRPEVALDCYQRAMDIDPLVERFYERAMRLLAGMGRVTAAQRVYEKCRANLESGLGVSPSAKLTGLHRQLKTSS